MCVVCVNAERYKTVLELITKLIYKRNIYSMYICVYAYVCMCKKLRI